MKVATIITALALGATFALPIGAQPSNQPTSSQPPAQATCPHHQEMNGPQGDHPFWKSLNLTADQQAKLKALRDEQAPNRKANQEKMGELRVKIKEEMMKDKPDQAALEKLAAQIGDLHKQMAMDRTAHLLKIKLVLNKEQFAKVLDKEDKRMGPGMGCPFMGDSAKACKGKMKGCPHQGMQNPPDGGK